MNGKASAAKVAQWVSDPGEDTVPDVKNIQISPMNLLGIVPEALKEPLLKSRHNVFSDSNPCGQKKPPTPAGREV